MVRLIRIAVPAVIVLAQVALVPAAAAGETPLPAVRAETRRLAVSLADLDLGSVAGASLARRRLAAVARALCRRWVDSRTAAHDATYADCVSDALQQALADLEALRGTRLAARPDARGSPP